METLGLSPEEVVSIAIASFIGSGINGNNYLNPRDIGNQLDIASFIGSGINGNIHTHQNH